MCTVARTHNSRFFASGADVSTIGYVHCPATVPAFEYKLSDRKNNILLIHIWLQLDSDGT